MWIASLIAEIFSPNGGAVFKSEAVCGRTCGYASSMIVLLLPGPTKTDRPSDYRR